MQAWFHVIFSETAASSQWVKGELNIAFEEQKTIIPFRLDNTPMKGQNRVMLNKTHWIDAYPDYKTKFNDLVSAVAQAIGKIIDPPPAGERPPKKSPSSCVQDDGDFFIRFFQKTIPSFYCSSVL